MGSKEVIGAAGLSAGNIAAAADEEVVAEDMGRVVE
jgi:hypothetical protein